MRPWYKGPAMVHGASPSAAHAAADPHQVLRAIPALALACLRPSRRGLNRAYFLPFVALLREHRRPSKTVSPEPGPTPTPNF